MSEKELTTVSVEPHGVIVRLTAAEAHIPSGDMESLYVKHGVDTGEIRRGTPKDAFKRACREFQNDYNSKFKSEGIRLIRDNVGCTADNEQIFLFRRGLVDTQANDSDYSDVVAKVFLQSEKTNNEYTGGAVIALADNDGVRESLQTWFDHEWGHYRMEQWRHTNRRNLESMTGAVMLDSGIYWVPVTYEDGTQVFSDVNNVPTTNEQALSNMQSMFRDLEQYQTCSCRSKALSTRQSSAMVLRYGGGAEAEDMHKQVIEAVVAKAETIAGSNWQDALQVAKKEGPVNARTMEKFLKANQEVATMVNKVNETIGGDLARANRALSMIERAVSKVMDTKKQNKGDKK